MVAIVRIRGCAIRAIEIKGFSAVERQAGEDGGDGG